LPPAPAADSGPRRAVEFQSPRHRRPVKLSFPASATVADAKAEIAERWDLRDAPPVVLYRGKVLGDRIVLARLRLSGPLRVFICDDAQMQFPPDVALRPVGERYRLTGVRAVAPVVTVDVVAPATAGAAAAVVAGVVGVADDARIAIVQRGRVLPEAEALADAADGAKFGFTVNAPAVARFRRARRGEASGDDDEALLAALRREITDGDLEEIERERGNCDLAEAIALFLQAGHTVAPLTLRNS
jgi:hypothetical protein